MFALKRYGMLPSCENENKNEIENENENKNENENENEKKTKMEIKMKSFYLFVNSTWPRGAIDDQLSLTWSRSAIAFLTSWAFFSF